MAIIKAGILSKVSGKVAGVVGSTWKGTNYLRERVKPSNPNTALQQRQRNKMRSIVAFARPILGNVLATFVDPFCKEFSGYNWFVKNNIAKIDPETGLLTAAPAIAFGSADAPSFRSPVHDGETVTFVASSDWAVPAGYTASAVVAMFKKGEIKSMAAVKAITSLREDEGVSVAFGQMGLTPVDGDFACIAIALYDANGNLAKCSNSIGGEVVEA